MAKSAKEKALERWGKPGFEGFQAWFDDIQPHTLHSDRKYKPLVLLPWQVDILKEALAVDCDGHFTHSLSLLTAPRRHSKSTLWLMVCLWVACSKPNSNVFMYPSTLEHGRRTQLKPLHNVINNTPKLKALLVDSILAAGMSFADNGSSIMLVTPSFNSAFGDKCSLLWVSDLHSHEDLAGFNAFQASLLDTEDSLILVDSNPDQDGGPVHALEVEAQSNPRIFVYKREYNDLSDFNANAPEWIDREKVRRLQATTLEHEFLRDILGKRGSGKYSLFPKEYIEKCQSDYALPMSKEMFEDLTKGREFIVTSGIDRAKRLFGGDGTIVTTILKTARPDGESVLYICNQTEVIPNELSYVKKAILNDVERYKPKNIVLEDYETQDLRAFLDHQKIPSEYVAAHNKNQNTAFLDLHRHFKEERIALPLSDELVKELTTFAYAEGTAGKYSFGSINKRKFKDDRIYSLAWALFASRKAILSLYKLGNIVCTYKRPTRSMCILFGGEAILPCNTECQAFHLLKEQHKHFSKVYMEDISLPTFFSQYVKHTGAKVYQAA
jgi:hypothetical protein